MAVPTRDSQKSPTDSVGQLKNLTQRARDAAATGAQQGQAGSFTGQNFLDLFVNLRGIKQQTINLLITPGVQDELRAEINEPAFNTTTEYRAFTDAIEAVLVQMEADQPVDGSGFMALHKIEADRRVTPRPFSVADMATLSALLVTLRDVVRATA